MSPSPHIPLPDISGIVRRQHENDEREVDLWNAIVQSRFTGTRADIVRMELAKLGLETMSRLLHSGWIHERSAEVGRPVPRDFSHRDGGLDGLAGLIVAHAMRLFQKWAVKGQGWRPDGGLSMASYFVGTCIRVARQAREEWQPDFDLKRLWVELPENIEAPPEPVDEDQIGWLIRDLAGVDKEICDIVAKRVQHYTYQEIAEMYGVTPKAIEGRVARFLKKLRSGVRHEH